MTTETKCPVCLSIDVDTRCRPITADEFECDVCGCYTADVDLAVLARDGVYDTDHWELSKIQRAVLSHGIRLRTDDQRHRPTQSVELYARDSGWARAENTDRDVVRLSLISTLISYRPEAVQRAFADHSWPYAEWSDGVEGVVDEVETASVS